MKTLILYPPVLPYGYTLHHRFAKVWEVADYLRRKNYDVSVMDAGLLNMLKGQILAEFSKRYDVVAVFCDPQAILTTLDLAERCKAISPITKIIVYGSAALAFPQKLQSNFIDALGRKGDLEAQVRQFIDYIQDGNEKLSNISLRQENNWIEPIGKEEFIPASQWGYPDFLEMPMDDIRRIYAMKDDTLKVSVSASKGCPYACTFCATPSLEGKPDRRRDPAELADFVAANQLKYDAWQFYSATFTLNRRWCLRFFDELKKREVKIRWKCTTRVDRLDTELVEAMAEAGCYMVGIGVETIGKGRDKIKKDITDEEIEKAILLLVKNNIIAKSYIMLGLPGQSLEEIQYTIRFIENLGGVVRPALYSPLGEIDGLKDEISLDDSLETISSLDKKSFIRDKTHYGEYLQLVFGQYKCLSPVYS